MKKIVGLNYLRAISALLVVFYHYTTRYLDIFYNMGAEASHIGLWWGCRAVPVFFMLSGLLTIYNLKPETTILSFETKRVIRLYPAYWVAILITTFTTYLFMPQLKVGLMPTLFNFTMLQGFVNITPVDGAYWTLRYEIWFYQKI